MSPSFVLTLDDGRHVRLRPRQASTPRIVSPERVDALRRALEETYASTRARAIAIQQASAAFDGSKIISQAGAAIAAVESMGGATKLTEAEQAKLNNTLNAAIDKYTALGKTAPAVLVDMEAATHKADDTTAQLGTTLTNAFENPVASLQTLGQSILDGALNPIVAVTVAAGAGVAAIAAVTAAAIALAEHAADSGVKVGDLALKMNDSVRSTSVLQAGFQAAGEGMDQVGAASFNLDKRLDENFDAVSSGLKALGIDVMQFAALNPADRMLELSDAFRALPPWVDKAAIAFELFGKSGQDQLVALQKPLSDLVDQSRALGLEWTDHEVAAANEFKEQSALLGEAIDRLKDRIGEEFLPVLSQLVEYFSKSETFVDFAVGLAAVSGAVHALAAEQETLTLVPAEVWWAQQKSSAEAFLSVLTLMPAGIGDVSRSMLDLGTSFDKAHTAMVAAQQKQADQQRALDVWYQQTQKETKALGDQLAAQDKAADSAEKAAQRIETAWEHAAAQSTAAWQRDQDAFQKDIDGRAALVAKATGQLADQTAKAAQHALDVQISGNQKSADTAISAMTDIDKRWSELNESTLQRALDAAVAWRDAQMKAIAPLQTTFPEIYDGLKAKVDDVYAGMVTSAEMSVKGQVDAFQQILGVLGLIEGAFSALGSSGGAVGQAIQSDLRGAMALVSQFKAISNMSGTNKTVAGLGATAAGVAGDVGAIQSGNVTSGIMSGAETGMGAATLLSQAGIIGSTAAIGAATMGIGAAVVGGIALYKKLTASAGRDLVKSFADSLGGFDALHKQLDALGDAGEQLWISLTQGVGKNNPQQAQAAIDAVNKALGDQATKIQTITDDWNSAEQQAAQFGAKVPVSLDTVMEKLLAIGDTKDAQSGLDQLTDAVKKYQDQLDDVSSFQNVEQEMQSVGLTADDMNGKFKQMADEESARTIAQQWADLAPYVSDVNVLANKFLGQVQGIIQDSELAGTAVPDNLKPIIQSLITQGELLDQNGNAITDISTINFEEDPLAKGLDDLNKTLQELVDVLTKDLPAGFQDTADAGSAAADQINRSFSDIDLPKAIAGGSPGDSGGEDGTPHLASGGYVPARPGGTLVTLGEGGQGEYVVPASQMGGGGYNGPSVVEVHVGGEKFLTIDMVAIAAAQGRIQIPSRAVTQRSPRG
jgi:hypothetical protein